MSRLAAAVLSMALASCGCASYREAKRRQIRPWGLQGKEFMVAADHSQASAAGAFILANGGNAVDAAVASAFALAVARPSSAGLGGGGFMLLRVRGQAPVAVDFREAAPSNAVLRNYADGRVLISTRAARGPWAVAVPGQVRGLTHALQTYGTKPLAEVLAPAIELAERGVLVDSFTHDAMADLARAIARDPQDAARYSELAKLFLRDERSYPIGSLLRQPELAATLRLLAKEGPDAFYRGDLAKRIREELGRRGVAWTEADLADYSIRSRVPISGSYRGYQIVGMPPPSAGGACLLEILHILEGYDLAKLPAGELHRLLAEAFKHAFADRGAYLGDPDSSPEAAEDALRMASADYAAALRKTIGDRTQAPASYGGRGAKLDAGTSHVSVIDKEGNAVALTETVNLPFGSWIVPPGTGFVLNGSMDDFSLKPGAVRLPGVRAYDRNAIGPGRRPLSSMSPTLVLKDDKVVAAVGASGGPLIITSVAQALVRVLDLGQRPDLALAEPRIHHQLYPNVLYAERGLPGEIRKALRDAGHDLQKFPLEPACQIVTAQDGLFGASDPRKGGRPAGR
ncbi:MAG TPA: gamma-glutamyltransferase [Elusimicrobiota bacterium]|nr:gamma-glutamyltransferase [Elusimicrobiota bacterium]